MSLPITARVKGMSKKTCSCAKKCGCGSMAKKLDPMYNGKPGVQKDDFKQF
jgi:hypothetical protein